MRRKNEEKTHALSGLHPAQRLRVHCTAPTTDLTWSFVIVGTTSFIILSVPVELRSTRGEPFVSFKSAIYFSSSAIGETWWEKRKKSGKSQRNYQNLWSCDCQDERNLFAKSFHLQNGFFTSFAQGKKSRLWVVLQARALRAPKNTFQPSPASTWGFGLVSTLRKEI